MISRMKNVPRRLEMSWETAAKTRLAWNGWFLALRGDEKAGDSQAKTAGR
jgi:hypothetical protein